MLDNENASVCLPSRDKADLPRVHILYHRPCPCSLARIFFSLPQTCVQILPPYLFTTSGRSCARVCRARMSTPLRISLKTFHWCQRVLRFQLYSRILLDNEQLNQSGIVSLFSEHMTQVPYAYDTCRSPLCRSAMLGLTMLVITLVKCPSVLNMQNWCLHSAPVAQPKRMDGFPACLHFLCGDVEELCSATHKR